MAASKPTSSLSMRSHFLFTKRHFDTLAVDLGCCPFDYEAYPPQSYCHIILSSIRSLIEFGRLNCPLVHSVLYPLKSTCDAAPKYISRRTSYYGVWLAFHSYPQLIRGLLKVHRFGLSHCFNNASTWSGVDHHRFGFTYRNFSPFSTCFRYALPFFG